MSHPTPERDLTEPAAPERHGPPPTGTLVVIAVLLMAISSIWLLVLGILQGRA